MASSLIANSLEQKEKFLCKKGVQLPQVWFGIPTWPPFCSVLEHWYGETLIRILAVEVKVRHRAIDLFAHFPQYTSFATIHLICPPSPLPPTMHSVVFRFYWVFQPFQKNLNTLLRSPKFQPEYHLFFSWEQISVVGARKKKYRGQHTSRETNLCFRLLARHPRLSHLFSAGFLVSCKFA